LAWSEIVRKRFFFVCTHRSARPQVVEGRICPLFPRIDTAFGAV